MFVDSQPHEWYAIVTYTSLATNQPWIHTRVPKSLFDALWRETQMYDHMNKGTDDRIAKVEFISNNNSLNKQVNMNTIDFLNIIARPLLGERNVHRSQGNNFY
jgi:hypothetical protein